jgi:hypothetical protein
MQLLSEREIAGLAQPKRELAATPSTKSMLPPPSASGAKRAAAPDPGILPAAPLPLAALAGATSKGSILAKTTSSAAADEMQAVVADSPLGDVARIQTAGEVTFGGAGMFLSVGANGKLWWGNADAQEFTTMIVDGKVVLQAGSGKFVVRGADGSLRAVGESAGRAEAFEIAALGNGVSIRSASGLFVKPEASGGAAATSATAEPIAFSGLDLSRLPGSRSLDTSSLKNAQGKFARVPASGELTWGDAEQQFEVVTIDGKTAYKAPNGRWPSVGEEG